MKRNMVVGTVRIVACHPDTQRMVSASQTTVANTRTACKREGDSYIRELKAAGYIIVHHHMEYKDVEETEDQG